MRILAINSGSSSIKCAVLDSESHGVALALRIENIGERSARKVYDGRVESIAALTYDAALEQLMCELQTRKNDLSIDAIAHRIVHGGDRFMQPTRIDRDVLGAIEALSALAPLHNPPALTVLRAAQKAFPDLPHIAVFDTAFHATLPTRAREYALPRGLTQRLGLRRFGFHGINHAHVMHTVATELHTTPQQLRIVSCHLGNGASVTAIEYGRSVETSMGMTPLEGLVMGTRSGDIDPGIVLKLAASTEFDAASLDRLLNSQSGLLGLTGTMDFSQIEQRAAQGDESCRAAIVLYAHRIRKYIGAYAAVMGGVDVIAFTGGVGEHSAVVRHRACQRLEFLGAVLDEDRNRDAGVSDALSICDLSADVSRVKLFVVRADEELQMTLETAALLSGSSQTSASERDEAAQRIPIAVSARHAHLTMATIERLFGAGYQLNKRGDLSQHGQYAAQETITLIGPKGRLEHVRLMGPPRKEDQIEISRSDEFVLGIDAPVRLSGDLANTPGITLQGPKGQVTIPRGVICARRHIHMSPDDARRLGVSDCDSVQVRIDSDGRDVVFADVTVRVAPDFQLELHLDTDEANAAGVVPHQEAELLSSTKASASILSRNVSGTRS